MKLKFMKKKWMSLYKKGPNSPTVEGRKCHAMEVISFHFRCLLWTDKLPKNVTLQATHAKNEWETLSIPTTYPLKY